MLLRLIVRQPLLLLCIDHYLICMITDKTNAMNLATYYDWV